MGKEQAATDDITHLLSGTHALKLKPRAVSELSHFVSNIRRQSFHSPPLPPFFIFYFYYSFSLHSCQAL